jgi:hypothetical protein
VRRMGCVPPHVPYLMVRKVQQSDLVPLLYDLHAEFTGVRLIIE